MVIKRFILYVFLFLLGACASMPTQEPSTLTVSAAADLIPAFNEIGTLFTTQTGVQVTFNYGSTGQLAQQIERGASVDVYAAANEAFVQDLDTQGLLLSDSIARYAQGFLTLWTRADSPLIVTSLEDLTQDAVKRIAIANPDHAPYGKLAKEVLETTNLWDLLQPKLVFGENIAQTLQYAETGNVDVALVALSLSIAAGDEGRYVRVPTELHAPLWQALAVVKSTQNETQARAFVAFVLSEKGREVLDRYGFVPPDTP